MAVDNYDLLRYMRVIEDYPKKGISFKDITTLLKVPEAFEIMKRGIEWAALSKEEK